MPSNEEAVGPLGDLDPEVFRRYGHEVVDWIAGFLESPERYPVLARVKPGDVRGALPTTAPDGPEPLDRVLADFERVIFPASRTGTTRASSPTSPSAAPPRGSSASSCAPR